MKDSTLKLLFAGGLTIVALIAALVVVVTGMVMDMSVPELIAAAAIFTHTVALGAAFFFGHQNGYKNGQRSNGAS